MRTNPDRFVEKIYQWRDKKRYNFVLGDKTVSTAGATKMAIKWGMKLHRDRRPDQRNPGEFLVKVGHHLPRRLRVVFREEQVVSFMANSDSRINRDVLKEGQDSIEAVVAEMVSNGVSKESADQFCFDVTQRVYNGGRGNDAVQPAVQPAATRSETPRRSPRKRSRAGVNCM